MQQEEDYRVKIRSTQRSRQELDRALERVRNKIAQAGIEADVIEEAVSAARRRG